MLARLKEKDIEARPKADQIDEAAIQQMLLTMIKQRRESIELYNQGKRPELAAKEQAEIGMIEAYMPQAAGEDQLRAIVAEAITELAQTSGQKPGPRDMGAAMKLVQQRIQATGLRADGKLVSELVKAELAK